MEKSDAEKDFNKSIKDGSDMKVCQSDIYDITRDNYKKVVERFPFLVRLEKDYEGLFMVDAISEHVFCHLKKLKEKRLVPPTKASDYMRVKIRILQV